MSKRKPIYAKEDTARWRAQERKFAAEKKLARELREAKARKRKADEEAAARDEAPRDATGKWTVGDVPEAAENCACGHPFHPGRVCGVVPSSFVPCRCCAAPHSTEWACTVCGRQLTAEPKPGFYGTHVVAEQAAKQRDPAPIPGIRALLGVLDVTIERLEERLFTILRPEDPTAKARVTDSDVARLIEGSVNDLNELMERLDL